MWSAHLGLHLATSASSLSPMLHHAYADLGGMAGGTNFSSPHAMAAVMAMSRPVDTMLVPGAKGFSVLSLQVWALDVGLLWSLYAGWKIAGQMATSQKARLAMFAIWAAGGAAMYAACIWLCTQPMQMRGMGMG
jgi:hypothetical protein